MTFSFTCYVLRFGTGNSENQLLPFLVGWCPSCWVVEVWGPCIPRGRLRPTGRNLRASAVPCRALSLQTGLPDCDFGAHLPIAARAGVSLSALPVLHPAAPAAGQASDLKWAPGARARVLVLTRRCPSAHSLRSCSRGSAPAGGAGYVDRAARPSRSSMVSGLREAVASRRPANLCAVS